MSLILLGIVFDLYELEKPIVYKNDVVLYSIVDFYSLITLIQQIILLFVYFYDL